jgi:twitching motility protein PilT
MQLLDDHLFKLWQNETATKQDALGKANVPEELARRIAAAERGLFDDDADVERAAKQGEKSESKEAAKQES